MKACAGTLFHLDIIQLLMGKARIAICFFVVLFMSFSPLAQNASWEEKVTSKLKEALAIRDDASFLVVMRAQADLSAADRLRTKESKGRYVYETLSALSENTQGAARQVLREAGAYYNSFWIINALSSSGSSAVVNQLAQLPEVARIEQNPVWHFEAVPEFLAENTGVQARTLTPASWGLTQINADDVWAMGYTGAGVLVGGQDTGYEWEHPAIKSKYKGWNGTSADHNYHWHDAIRTLIGSGTNSCGLNLPAPCDDHSHGTHTMGTMTGSASDAQVIGVAPNARWIGCRNMEEGDGQPSTYIECFQWFVAPTDLNNLYPDPLKAPDVINNSWGCPISEGCNSDNFATMDAVVNNVRAAGIVVVVSAGNSGSACSSVDDPPAIFAGTFAVGATDNTDNIAGFSSRGPVTVYGSRMKPDISAPGVSIYSCVGINNTAGTYGYSSYSGTSMAGPHVAGVVALMISAKPSLRGQVNTIENLIKNSAIPRYAVAPFCGSDHATAIPNNVYGYGRIDALSAVSAALPVELVVFEGKTAGKVARLYWETAAELHCAAFGIQRSCDGIQWQTIGEVACKDGSRRGITAYSFEDSDPCQGLNYYRLQQKDLTGALYESWTVVLSVTGSGYSLRTASSLQDGAVFMEVIGANAASKTWYVQLHAADGRLVQRLSVPHVTSLSLPWLPRGVYALLLYDDTNTVVASAKLFR